jgi:osmotically-inducible protein OsmY
MMDLKHSLKAVRRPMAAVLICGAVLVSLQGCVGIMVGGAAVGALAVTDRRTIGAQTEDKAIGFKADSRIYSVIPQSDNVKVTSFNRKVLLTGEVRAEASKAAAEREVASIEGVQSVINELGIGEASSFSSRSNDTLITGKVKASFLDQKNFYGNAVKVVTERGIVYLMGRVTEREGNIAADIARGVDGVQKVVKVFEYISEEEYRQLTTTTDSTPPK